MHGYNARESAGMHGYNARESAGMRMRSVGVDEVASVS